MKKKLLTALFGLCLCITMTGCGSKCTCSNCNCGDSPVPADTGAEDDALQTGAYAFKVTDSEGKALSNVKVNVDVVRNISQGTWVKKDPHVFDLTSDEDGYVTFTLSQLENVESDGEYGLWDMREVEDRTPEEDKQIREDTFGDKEAEGLHCTDDKGGEYTGFYYKNNYGEYRTYFLGYKYAGEQFAQHAVHQCYLEWEWERTINGIFSHTFSVEEWDEEECRFVTNQYEGGHIKVSLDGSSDGYHLDGETKALTFDYTTSGEAYDKYVHTADYVFTTAPLVLSKSN